MMEEFEWIEERDGDALRLLRRVLSSAKGSESVETTVCGSEICAASMVGRCVCRHSLSMSRDRGRGNSFG